MDLFHNTGSLRKLFLFCIFRYFFQTRAYFVILVFISAFLIYYNMMSYMIFLVIRKQNLELNNNY